MTYGLGRGSNPTTGRRQTVVEHLRSGEYRFSWCSDCEESGSNARRGEAKMIITGRAAPKAFCGYRCCGSTSDAYAIAPASPLRRAVRRIVVLVYAPTGDHG